MCHAEAIVSMNSLAAQLRNEVASGSHSNTPDMQSAHSTPPKPATVSLRISTSHSPSPQSKFAGTKRNIESDDPSLPAEAEGSSPTKKLAVES